MNERVTLHDCGPGRSLLVEPGGAMYAGRGYEIHQSDDGGLSWRAIAALPIPWKRRPAEFSRIAARLLRFEVRALARLSDGTLIAANRDGIYRGSPSGKMMEACGVEAGGQPVKYPLTVTVGPNDVVLWGEYNAETGHGTPMRVFASADAGRTFEIVHVFDEGEILHVHSILYDPALRHYWVFTGDFDTEPGIGVLSEDLTAFDWFLKGEQRFRLCEAFDFGDRLVYATDTPLESNAILSLDKQSGRIDKLRDVEGSCLYACRFGSWFAFSTTIEPGAADATKSANLWLSQDGDDWHCALGRNKDRWPAILQFGSLVLPRGESDEDRLFLSGQAVQAIDGRLQVAHLGAE